MYSRSNSLESIFIANAISLQRNQTDSPSKGFRCFYCQLGRNRARLPALECHQTESNLTELCYQRSNIKWKGILRDIKRPRRCRSIQVQLSLSFLLCASTGVDGPSSASLDKSTTSLQQQQQQQQQQQHQ